MINMIVATSTNNLIGCDNKMPWHISEDLRYFKEKTMQSTVVMGRKTFESIGKPLPNRRNIVLTHNKNFSYPNIEVFHSIEETLSHLQTLENSFIIGGGEIYKSFLPYADKLFITLIDKTVEGDTAFVEYKQDFKCISRIEKTDLSCDLQYEFTEWVRI
ncbi:MAG: diacylglycerol kinase [Epulopiscium sp. Nele67-Bin005]|nr:MAG: diacylglycerol kinase [Epulopiscium sp. Nele67-Bin005]